MTRNLALKVNMKSDHRDHVHISYNCPNGKCDIKSREELKVNGTVKLSDYFNTENIKARIVFEGTKENLMLNINVLHSCNCKTESNSSLCNHGGSRSCGICECYQDR